MIWTQVISIFIISLSLANVAWGQIAPQDQPSIPSQTQPSMAGARPSVEGVAPRPPQIVKPRQTLYRTTSSRSAMIDRQTSVYFNQLYRENMEEYQRRYEEKYGETLDLESAKFSLVLREL